MKTFTQHLVESLKSRFVSESEPKEDPVDMNLRALKSADHIKKAGTPQGYWNDTMYVSKRMADQLYHVPDREMKHFTIRHPDHHDHGWGEQFTSLDQLEDPDLERDVKEGLQHFNNELEMRGHPEAHVTGVTRLYAPIRHYVHLHNGSDEYHIHVQTAPIYGEDYNEKYRQQYGHDEEFGGQDDEFGGEGGVADDHSYVAHNHFDYYSKRHSNKNPLDPADSYDNFDKIIPDLNSANKHQMKNF